MDILIISLAVDPHGIAVAAALEQHGHNVVVWCEPLLAGTYRGTVDFTEDEVHWSFGGARYSPSDFDIVWLRRHSRIEMPKWIHGDDLIYAQQENNAFFRWFWSGLSAQTVWIHSLCGYLTSETKAIQLNAAKKNWIYYSRNDTQQRRQRDQDVCCKKFKSRGDDLQNVLPHGVE